MKRATRKKGGTRNEAKPPQPGTPKKRPLMTEGQLAVYVGKSIHSVRRDRRLGLAPRMCSLVVRSDTCPRSSMSTCCAPSARDRSRSNASSLNCRAPISFLAAKAKAAPSQQCDPLFNSCPGSVMGGTSRARV